MKHLTRIALLAAASSLIAGCQGSPLKGWKFARSTPSTLEQPKFAAAQVLQEGRAQLRSGHVAAAVASFRMAQLDPDTAAEANNGLGVAYSKLGRMDLADRYFRQAIQLAPTDMRFTANLLRMQHKVTLARRAREDTRQSDLAQREEVSEAIELASAEPVFRRTRGAFHIRTRGELGAGPDMNIEYRRSASVEVEDEAADNRVARIEIASAETPDLIVRDKSREIILSQ